MLEALAEHRGVLALRAGSVLSERVRAELTGHTVAHLTVELATVVARIKADPTRSVRSVDPVERLGKADSIRTPLYRALATFTVATDHRAPDEVAAAVLGGLASGASR